MLLDLQQLSDLVFFEEKLNPLFDFVHSFSFLSTHSDSVVFLTLVAVVWALIEKEIKNAREKAIIVYVDFFIIPLFCLIQIYQIIIKINKFL